MSFKRWMLIIMGVAALFAVGFLAGQAVVAQPGTGAVPGSADDPLVAQSFVDKLVGDTVDSMRRQVEDLNARLDELTRVVAVVEAQKGSPPPPPVVQPTPQPVTRRGVVTATSANMRSGPGTGFLKIVTLNKNASFTVWEERDGWVRISLTDGQTGWVSASLVRVE